MSALTLSITRIPDDTTTIVADGRLDGNTAHTFGDFVGENLTPEDTSLIIDASRLTFISSAGLRELMILAKQLFASKRKAAIHGLSPAVREILEISGMVSLFHITADRPAAEKSLAEQSKGFVRRLFTSRSET